ncbi:Lrp/AsnC family transcriptional regulator [Candidatus Woesearchaeota archaeon]|jgi:Lrp/AsnC family transcriptional regulator, regulator for asnA, asnC and gidA|nr:Lrp/AsnC family transcriptional regulator [Candidatus Woesearchaeota archaeon]
MKKTKIDDMKILSHLRKNARTSLTKLSKYTGIPISTIFEKIKTHEKELITKHTSIIDFFKLGYTTRANIVIKIDKKNRNEIEEFLLKHQNVNSVYKITNNFDFLIEGIFLNLLELEKFHESLEDKFKIKSKQTYYILKDIKREGFMSNPELIDIFQGSKDFV